MSCMCSKLHPICEFGQCDHFPLNFDLFCHATITPIFNLGICRSCSILVIVALWCLETIMEINSINHCVKISHL